MRSRSRSRTRPPQCACWSSAHGSSRRERPGSRSPPALAGPRGHGPRRLHRVRREHRRVAARDDPRGRTSRTSPSRPASARARRRTRARAPRGRRRGRRRRASSAEEEREHARTKASLRHRSARTRRRSARRPAGGGAIQTSMRSIAGSARQTSPQSMTPLSRAAGNEQVTDVEVAVREHAPRARRSRSPVVEELLDAVCRRPTRRTTPPQPLPRPSDAKRHVRTTVRSRREATRLGSTARECLRIVEHAKEAAKRQSRAFHAPSSSRLRIAWLQPCGGAVLRRTATGTGHSARPTNARLGDRRRKQRRRAAASTAISRSTPGMAILATREPERPALLDDPDRVVPALAQKAGGVDVELGELLCREGAARAPRRSRPLRPTRASRRTYRRRAA